MDEKQTGVPGWSVREQLVGIIVAAALCAMAVIGYSLSQTGAGSAATPVDANVIIAPTMSVTNTATPSGTPAATPSVAAETATPSTTTSTAAPPQPPAPAKTSTTKAAPAPAKTTVKTQPAPATTKPAAPPTTQAPAPPPATKPAPATTAAPAPPVTCPAGQYNNGTGCVPYPKPTVTVLSRGTDGSGTRAVIQYKVTDNGKLGWTVTATCGSDSESNSGSGSLSGTHAMPIDAATGCSPSTISVSIS